VGSPGRAGDEAQHPGSVEPGHAVGADVGAAGLADRLAVQHHLDRGPSGGARLHHQVDLAGGEGEDDPARPALELDVLRGAPPAPFEGHRAPLAPVGAEVGLARDAGVRRLARPREGGRFGTDGGKGGSRVGREQEPPDLHLDLGVAALAHPPLHQLATGIEEVLRRPGVVAEGLPRGEVVVEGDRVGEPVLTNPTIDVLGPLSELELGRVHADHDQAAAGVVAVPRLDVGRGANPVDAGVLPDIEQHDLAAQCLDSERRRVHPTLHRKGRQLAGRAHEARTGHHTREQERQNGSHR